MIDKIFIENECADHPGALHILALLKREPNYIERVDDVFGRVFKPYLQKRQGLNLFLGKKRGKKIKEAPPAYGQEGTPHFYHIHSYNCVYECQYCYLQGYFNSPDLVLFLNHDEIIQEMETIADQYPKGLWFHAGEFSDSLALSHLSKELSHYFEFFSKNPHAKLELRTKSSNDKELLSLPPLKNVITSFSLAPDSACREFDLKAPPLASRLKSMERLQEAGHPLAIHLDPIIFHENVIQDYTSFIEHLAQSISLFEVEYISVGVVRFTKEVFQRMKKHYPESSLLNSPLSKSTDGKVRYSGPMRRHLLHKIKSLLMKQGVSEEKVYLCMEEE